MISSFVFNSQTEQRRSRQSTRSSMGRRGQTFFSCYLQRAKVLRTERMMSRGHVYTHNTTVIVGCCLLGDVKRNEYFVFIARKRGRRRRTTMTTKEKTAAKRSDLNETTFSSFPLLETRFIKSNFASI